MVLYGFVVAHLCGDVRGTFGILWTRRSIGSDDSKFQSVDVRIMCLILVYNNQNWNSAEQKRLKTVLYVDK